MTVFVLSFFALFVACLAARQPQRPVLSESERMEHLKKWMHSDSFCKDIEGNMMHPYRCKDKTDQDVDEWAKEFLSTHAVDAQNISPVILVPGFAGSGIDGYLDRNDTPAFFCFKKWREWFNLWLALYEVLANTCLLDNAALRYNATTHTYKDQEGVKTRPRDFGGLKGVDYVDPNYDIFGMTAVYAEMTKKFKAVGYEAGKTLFGAPFDFRVPLHSMMDNGFAEAFYNLIDTAYKNAGNKPVTIVSHSYGGPTVLYFMNNFRPAGMSTTAWEAWLKTHVQTFVPIAGPWSGTPRSLRGILSGDSFGAPSWLVYPQTVAKTTRTYGGLVQLVPDPHFWPKNKTFVTTPSRNYTASEADMAQLFADAGATTAGSIYQYTKQSIDQLSEPLMRTVCLYGFDHETEISMEYANGLSKTEIVQPTSIDTSDRGDGTVPLASLLECVEWDASGPLKTEINCREFDLKGHEDLSDNKLIENVIAIATGTDDIKTCETTNVDRWVRDTERKHGIIPKAERIRQLKKRQQQE